MENFGAWLERTALAATVALICCTLACGGTISHAKSELDDSVRQAIADAHLSGSAIVAHTALKADLLSANLLEGIESEHQSLRDAATQLAFEAQRMRDCLDEEVDITVIDLGDLMPDLVPWMEERAFVIRAVKGTQIVKQDSGDYEIRVVGSGIGAIDEDRSRTSTVWEVNGKLLEPSRVSSTNAHRITLRIPSELLNSEFVESETVFIPVDVTHTKQRRGLFRRKVEYSTTFHIALLPEVAAWIQSVKQEISEQGFLAQAPATSSHHFDKVDEKTWNHVDRINLPAGAVVTSYQYDCAPDRRADMPKNPGSYCGWCYPTTRLGVHGDYGHDCREAARGDGGVTIHCYRQCQAGYATIKHTVHYDLPVGLTKSLEDMTPVAIAHGRPTILGLHESNIGQNYSIEGKTASGASFVLLSARRSALSLGLTSTVERIGAMSRVVVSTDGPMAHSRCSG